MKILHYAFIVKNNRAAGLSFSIPNLIKGQNLYIKKKSAHLYNIKRGIVLSKININEYDIHVLHSYFNPAFLKLLLFIPRSKKIVICPRGAFNILNRYTFKKRLYAALFFGIIKLRQLNVGLHFLTDNEKKNSRFHSIKEFVSGNSININNSINIDIQAKYKSKTIVFMGRFSSYHKGLDLLFDYLIEKRDEIIKYKLQFVFYGPESFDKKDILNRLKFYNISSITIKDEVYDNEKEIIYKEAMFNILNSRFEGFPMSVLESCALSTPQILSKGTNLGEMMSKNNFGLAFNSHLIERLGELTYEKYEKLSCNALKFAQQHSLKEIGKKTILLYNTL